MSLHARFLLLLGVLGAAVIANIAVTVWSVGLLDREQRRPAEQIGSVLGILNSTKRTLWEQAGQLGQFVQPEGVEPRPLPTPDELGPERIDAFRTLGAEALDQIDELDKLDASVLRAGVNTASNLRARITRVNNTFEAYLQDSREESGRVVLAELYTLHEFIELLEARLIDEARLSADHASDVQQRMMTTLASSVLSVLIALAAAAWLFRRWVIVRVDRLGLAAERIGRGDFEHRLEVAGNDELDRVAGQLNDMTRTIVAMQAERIERERLAAVGDLTRRLAHNIRNPLGGIRSLAELSELELPDDSPVRENQQRIIKTVDQFNRWLKDMLSVSNPLSVEPTEVTLEPWLSELIDTHRPLAESRAVRLTLDASAGPETARLDRRHMEHVVSALITNAIQASGTQTEVQIATRPAEDRWVLSVADQGTGIAPEHIESLFVPYFTTKPDGTGIGLAQARRVVVEHGGRIWAENRVSGGSQSPGAVFQVELPLQGPGTKARIGQKGVAESGQNSPSRR